MQSLNEVMTAQQRIKRGMIMARNRAKIERARERSRGRLADAKKIVERAMRLARQIVRKRVVGERGERYEELSPAEKVEIDKVMQKRKDAIKKVALRLIQQVRKKEFERYKSFYMGKQLDHLHTESVQEQNTEMLLEQMIGAAQHLLITEQDNIKLERAFGNNDDFDLYKNYFVEALALEDNDSEMAMLRVVLLEKIDTELLVAEESVPKNPKLWARAVAWAKRTYDEYPSKWANQGAAKWYKKHGGEWLTEKSLIEALVRRNVVTTKFSPAGNIKSDSTIGRRSRRPSTKITGGISGGSSLIRRRIIDKETGKVRIVEPSDFMRKIRQARLRTAARALRVGGKGGTSYHQRHTPSTSNRPRVSLRARRPM